MAFWHKWWIGVWEVHERKKKRIRRTREEIEADEQFSAAGRRETKKLCTSLDRFLKPVVRFNFIWHVDRLKIIESVADELDVGTEAFIRQAAYLRAIAESQNDCPVVSKYKRVLSNRYYRRWDVVPLSWRWRKPNVEFVEKAAAKLEVDFKTFVDLATYDQAVQIAQKAELNEIVRRAAYYVDSIKDDPDFGEWAMEFIAANPDFVETFRRR